MDMTKITLIVLVFLTTGCASNQYSVTYKTTPQGAEIVCGGKSWGYAPVTLNYTLDKATRQRGYLNTQACVAKWVSGATNTASTNFSISQYPNGVINTIPRPDEPNAQVDHQFALQLKQIELTERQIQREKDEAFLRGLEALQKSFEPPPSSQNTYTPPPTVNRSVNCTTQVLPSMSGMFAPTYRTNCR